MSENMVCRANSQPQTQSLPHVNILTLHYISLIFQGGLIVQIQASETSSHQVGDVGSARAAQDVGSRVCNSPPLLSHRKQLGRAPWLGVPGILLEVPQPL